MTGEHRARQSDTQRGRAPLPEPTTDLGDYVRAAQSGRESWSPNFDAEDDAPS
ncbi:MAG: hypothetical protein ACJA07_004484 [Rhodococcus sp. (in: high G+C Gram-positive bacteria)]